jgi:uncharacterized membrane protein YphA (DoxX/SURF4 family)
MSPILVILARLALGAVWIIAGTAKLAKKRSDNPVGQFLLLPEGVAAVVGGVLPWIELTLGILLFIGQWISLVAAISAGMLTIFTAAIVLNLLRGRRVECHCFGALGHGTISWLSVARNAALGVAAVIVMCAPNTYLSLEGWRKGDALIPPEALSLESVPVLLMMLAGLLLWVLALSTWDAAKAVAMADDGPALGQIERTYLRRWKVFRGSGEAVEER